MNELNTLEVFDMLDAVCTKFYTVARMEVIDGLASPRLWGDYGHAFSIQPTTLMEMRDMFGDLALHPILECCFYDTGMEITDTYIKTLVGAAIIQHAMRVDDNEIG